MMKRLYQILLFILIYNAFLSIDANGLGEPLYYEIDPERIEFVHTNNSNGDFMYDIKLVGQSSYGHYPTSYNNWGMSYVASDELTYIVFTDCDQVGHDWVPGTYDRVIAYNVIDADGEPMLSPEGEAEPTYAGYPDLATSSTGRPYVAFHKNDAGLYSWLQTDTYNLGGTQVIWNNNTAFPFAAGYVWPQIRMTHPNDGSEGVLYIMGLNGDAGYSAMVCKAIPLVDSLGWITDSVFAFENVSQVIDEEESILHPSLAVSDDGSVVGVLYTHGAADQAKCKYVYSTDEGATWSGPVELAYDNSPCDVNQDGESDGNWTVFPQGMHLFYNSLNQPCLSYIKNVTDEDGNYYPFTSKVFFGKIDMENEELIENRVSDVIDNQGDITGGCCGPNSHSIAARVSWYGTGQYLVIAWIDSRNALAEECENGEIYYSFSDDWGETWTTDINVSHTNEGNDDFDETWLAVAPQMSITEDYQPFIHLMFHWDTPSDDPDEITMNEIYYYQCPVYNALDENYKLVTKPTTKLLQNTPNPFNPETNISFELAEAGPVSLSIYNVKGQLVKKLIDDEVKAPGSHSVVWNGQNSAGASTGSGVYFYMLETQNSFEMKKMLLIK